MPVEAKRKYSSRRLLVNKFDPTSTYNVIDVPVIDEITFIDPAEQYQEIIFTFSNTNKPDRKTHKIGFYTDIFSLKYNTMPDLVIETIDRFKVVDRRENAQEYWYSLNGENPPVHLKSHFTKLISNDTLIATAASYPARVEESNWGPIIAVERIDEIIFKDPRRNNQETKYILDWSAEDETDRNPPSPSNEWNGTSINPPWRIDPFQAIVGINRKVDAENVISAWEGIYRGGTSYTFGHGGTIPLSSFIDPPFLWPGLEIDETLDGDEFHTGFYPSQEVTLATRGRQYPSNIGKRRTTMNYVEWTLNQQIISKGVKIHRAVVVADIYRPWLKVAIE